MPAHTVAALLAGQLEIIVEDLHILVQLRQVADFLPGQRAVPVGQQTVFKIHNGFHFQAPPGAVMGIVLVILHGVPQQSQMIPLPQDMIQRLHGAALPDVDVEPLNGCCPLQIIHRRIGGIGGWGIITRSSAQRSCSSCTLRSSRSTSRSTRSACSMKCRPCSVGIHAGG